MKDYIRILFLFFVLLLPVGVSAQHEQAKPRNGEGVHAFLARHNRKGSTYYREFLELNRGKLGRNNSLKLGVSYKLPPLKGGGTTQPKQQNSSSSAAKPVVGKTMYEPLFGPKLANVEIKSDALKDACFYIVSGHGGPDPGAIGKVGNRELHEDEYAYDIALRLARNLMMQGAKVYIIIQDAKDGIRDDRYLSNSKRETCMGAAIPLNQVQRLKQRSEKINQLYRKDKQNYKYCRSIFIHIDSRSKRQQTDVFFYHSGSTGSSRLANTMRSTFERKYRQHQPNRGFSGTVSERNLYVLKNTVPVGVYVELGNIQNEFDQKRIVMDSNRQALANWLCEGFVTDYKSR